MKIINLYQYINHDLRQAFMPAGAERAATTPTDDAAYGARAGHIARELGLHPALVHAVIALFETAHSPLADIDELCRRVRHRFTALSPHAAAALYRYNRAVPPALVRRMASGG